MLNIKFEEANIALAQEGALCLFFNSDLDLSASLMPFDQKHHGIIGKALLSKQSFTGKFGETSTLSIVSPKGDFTHIIMVGLGEEDKLTSTKLEELGGKAATIAASLKYTLINAFIPHKLGSVEVEEVAASVASGALLANYRFTTHFTKDVDKKESTLKNMQVLCANSKKADEAFVAYKSVAHGVYFARDLISQPSNHLYPASYAELVAEKLSPLGIDVEILGEREMHNLGMGALLGVGQGSLNESKLVVMKYIGLDDEEAQPIAFVGKGVTFDTGGISLKPAGGMEEMKYDMGGSAAVVGAMKALALRSAKVNAIGVIGLVENMPGGNAQKPGDVVTTMSGQTVEVINTDAEGRLVLADAVYYTQEKYNPKFIINLATLTGAVIIALGNTYAGCFSNDDTLAEQIIESGKETHEDLWKLPLHKDFDDTLKSECADMLNCPNNRGSASSSVAAQFIQRFVKKDVPWAHLDIAGKAWKKQPSSITPKGAVGYGVRLLNQLVHKYYESK